MSKFLKGGGREMPELNTASLPDLVFAFLFFIMMVTSIREVTMMVQVKLPAATEITKLEKKSLATYIYMGKPMSMYQAKYGTETQIQLNDEFASPNDIFDFIAQEKAAKNEEDAALMTTVLKTDESTKMGIVTEVKQKLREADARKIIYATVQQTK
ncbi:biopolymer transporter ExbD [Porphyromonas canoris]|uniref:ExbD/TolR family protein n=1 Tax=Porphyromonas TaxID=836 RepID=UPI00051CE48D|nr:MULTISPECIES: biopolymer transporter ExbD [Porphyromonas]KGL52861.1 biopolymer transporter ExbD [Porphyromonas canoris]KGN95579.1 biopolymer transporter ExbD [Porphyromonas sp. COT-108 OH2963]